ncbi:hypothetical protein CLV63_11384 [Murinocardiopsis flavida]|uniref:Uncharacterized protein n=1 Tax=Murinocardiopsis flavida TaxID=645275 RepID=A0A2P8DFC8_9ACTN|nr:hypothetical protein [Murinocardiopsis flavida]PSK95921.1 hypothetical protein CLV63_11384 [Murinocardiopsis flavida]
MRNRRTALAVLALTAALVSFTAACSTGSEDDGVDEPSAMSEATPERRTFDPSPAVEPGSEAAATLEQTTRKRVGALKIGLISVREGTASLSITGPGIEKRSPLVRKGAKGDVITLDNGITIAIDEVRAGRKSEDDPAPAGGSGSAVDLTVTQPE